MTLATDHASGLTVSVLLHDGGSAFELGIVTEIFGLPLPGFESSWYRLTVCAERPGPVPIFGGAAVDAQYSPDVFAAARTVILPGGDPDGEYPAPILEAVQRAHHHGARVVSIGTGTFVLAAAGILDGRRAATHWMFSDLLAKRFPLVQVDSTVLYTKDGNIFTSAGRAAGLDLYVHLVREDFGPTIANAMARRLIIGSHREGYQAQVIEKPVRVDPEDDRLASSMSWALSNLNEQITIDSLARRAHMSTRTYIRHFSSAMGTSPIRWLITQRVQASLPLLEKTQLSMEQVAARVGFERAVTYRHHFGRLMGESPTAYRRALNANRRRGEAMESGAGTLDRRKVSCIAVDG